MFFGIPGENTSLPLLSVRQNIINKNIMSQVHFISAIGSFIASLISGIFLYFTIDYYNNVGYLKSYVSLICAMFGIILCIFYSSNKFFTSLLLFIFGWGLSKIGYDDIYKYHFLTFGNPYLYAGLPTLPVLLGIYAIPSLLIMIIETKNIKNQIICEENNFNKIDCILENKWTIVRSSFIGYFSGLVPYLGNGISSFLAFFVEKKLQPQNYIAQSAASESANNSANLSVLIPLLMLGVAIIPSEFVLLEILLSSNQYFYWNTIYKNINHIIFFLFLSNCISCYLAWKFAVGIGVLLNKMKYIICIIILIFTTIGIWQLGIESSQEYYYMIVLIFFSIIGFMLKPYDMLPFTYGFLLQNNIEQLIYRVYQIYF
jgi:putative tricarboxylic transport membrane protein